MQVDPEKPLSSVQRKLERHVGLPVREQQLLVCAHSEATGRPRYSLLPSQSPSPASSAARDCRDCLERTEAAVLVRDVLKNPHVEHAGALQPPVLLVLTRQTCASAVLPPQFQRQLQLQRLVKVLKTNVL